MPKHKLEPADAHPRSIVQPRWLYDAFVVQVRAVPTAEIYQPEFACLLRLNHSVPPRYAVIRKRDLIGSRAAQRTDAAYRQAFATLVFEPGNAIIRHLGHGARLTPKRIFAKPRIGTCPERHMGVVAQVLAFITWQGGRLLRSE